MENKKNKDRYFTLIAAANFKATIKNAYNLLDLYKIRKNIPMPNRTDFDEPDAKISDEDAKVFLRSALIMVVTAIEGYIEYVVERFFEYKLKIASTPKDVENASNYAFASWCKGRKLNNLDDIKEWNGTNWKKLVLKEFNNDIKSFNTPSSKNINKLFKRYYSIPNIISQCKWKETSSKDVREVLDWIIKLRGRAVHKGKDLFEPYEKISFNHAEYFIGFSEVLIICLNKIIDEKGKELMERDGLD